MEKDFEEVDLSNKNVCNILERMTEGFYAVDREWRVTYWNNQAALMLGKTKQEVLGKVIWDSFSESVRLEYFEQFQKALSEQIRISFVARFTPLDIWTDLTVYPSSNGLSVYFRDITERVNADEEVKMLSLIAKETVNLVSVVGPDGKITWVNAAFTRITGYSFEEAIGRRNSELLFGAETDMKLVSWIIERMKRGLAFKTELLVYTKSKEKIWFEVSGQSLGKDQYPVTRYFLIQTDITERKRAEEELKRISLIVKVAPNGVAILDLNKKIVWVNESFSRITGFSSEETFGKRPRDLIRGAETDLRIVKRLHRHWEKAEPFHCENTYYNKCGEKIVLDLFCQPLFDSTGKVNQFFIIIKDLSEQKKLQDQLMKEKEARQKEVTNAAIKAQEQERSNVGKELHDNVNQVLTTVKLYNELCRDGIGNTHEMLSRSVSLLNDSINEIRNLSNRLSAPSIGKVRLKDSIKDLVESVSATNKVEVSLRTSKSLNDFYANDELHLAIYRILQEHLTNVLKHAEASIANIFLTKTMKSVTLKVVDNGKGFDVQAKRRGIGITNMKSRTESIKGKLTIVSAPGNGCTITASFPIANKEKKPARILASKESED